MDITSKLQTALDGSPLYRSIAEYLLANMDRAAFLSAAELAQQTGASHATIVRFAKSLGYSGYPEMLREIQDHLSRKLSTVERLSRSVQAPDEERPLLERIVLQDIRNLETALRELDRNAFEAAVSTLSSARTVFVAGFRSTHALAWLLTFSLGLVLERFRVSMVSPTEYVEQLTAADNRDAIVAFSFPRYYRLTLEVLRFARGRSVKAVAVTDSSLSPLAREADVVLTCPVELPSFIESFAAPVSLVNALVTGVALARRRWSMNRLASLEEVWERLNLYYSKERRGWNGERT